MTAGLEQVMRRVATAHESASVPVAELRSAHKVGFSTYSQARSRPTLALTMRRWLSKTFRWRLTVFAVTMVCGRASQHFTLHYARMRKLVNLAFRCALAAAALWVLRALLIAVSAGWRLESWSCHFARKAFRRMSSLLCHYASVCSVRIP